MLNRGYYFSLVTEQLSGKATTDVSNDDDDDTVVTDVSKGLQLQDDIGNDSKRPFHSCSRP